MGKFVHNLANKPLLLDETAHSSVIDTLMFSNSAKCVVCGKEIFGKTVPLCNDCVPKKPQKICFVCGREIVGQNVVCDNCHKNRNEFDIARSCFSYEGAVDAIIKKLKYGKAKYMADVITEFMQKTYFDNAFKCDLITFVPMHAIRLRQRGYNQAELIANSLGKKIGLQVQPLLEKIYYGKNMAKLDGKTRAEFIKDSFAFVGSNIRGRNVLLVDDVLTSGATANECARVIKSKRATTVSVITFASVRLKIENLNYYVDEPPPIEKREGGFYNG